MCGDACDGVPYGKRSDAAGHLTGTVGEFRPLSSPPSDTQSPGGDPPSPCGYATGQRRERTACRTRARSREGQRRRAVEPAPVARFADVSTGAPRTIDKQTKWRVRCAASSDGRTVLGRTGTAAGRSPAVARAVARLGQRRPQPIGHAFELGGRDRRAFSDPPDCSWSGPARFLVSCLPVFW